ncbi:MAG TPA: maleylpyruvate isomerase family mycothiol-dependent enzyme [Acidimicrobiales bacterium]|nr:maleylpyruvate isomerase family mycothiol-dependent enzyme [Acidimicrobiales bacterium]
MPTSVDRDRTVRLLDEEYSAVAELCRALSDEEWALATCLPGWSVKDQLSHMSGTEHLLAGDQAPEVAVGDAEHLKNDIARANEVWVEGNRRLRADQVLEDFVDVTRRRLQSLEAMTQEDFDAPSWTPAGPNETYGRFMRIRHFDCYMHEHDIRSAVGRPNRDDRDHVEFCLDEVATAIGYIVGRKARLPRGTTVTIELTGPVEVTYHVEVGERAAVVPRLAGPPTVTLRMPSPKWLRLTGGRTLDLSGVELSGDGELGRQLAANLVFTL